MHGMESLSIPARRSRPALLGSRRLLALAGDERLVEQIRRGSEVAFEVVFERYGVPILGFCRHLLASREEAEDAVQHTFAAAHRQLLRDERPIELKPWLYAIARNRCLSLLRARRAEPVPLGEFATDGLSEQVERRAELRELLHDVAELPFEQRAALLLAELGDLSHAQIATVLECEEARVKALVYRARSGLIARRDARALPCEQVREQLATLRGGALRRLELKHHLHVCPGCRAYRAEVKRQRQLLGAALPVAPSLGLKASVLGAIGIGGGSAGGGSGALIGGAQALLSSLGGAGAAKTAAAVVVATGAVVGGEAAVERVVDSGEPPAAVAPSPQRSASQNAADRSHADAQSKGPAVATLRPGRESDPAGVHGRSLGRAHASPAHGKAGSKSAVGAERAKGKGLGRSETAKDKQLGSGTANRPAVPPGQAKAKPGRGPVEAPLAAPPVKRGPPVKVKSPKAPRSVEHGASPTVPAQGKPQPRVETPEPSSGGKGKPPDVSAQP